MDPLVARLSAALGERYSIGELIGEGGTASVYRATDRRHGRDVAVKVLKSELAASLGTDRFLNEIQTTAALQHPHILPLFDSGEADGLVYYVTPLVAGSSLKERLSEGPLPVAEAVQLAEQVASALAYAHGQGLVHRDVKPANILLSSGRAVLADFGIARALTEAGGDRLTASGVSIGTPEYMSPEQIEADEIDGRADLYALGCVLFEMLTGEPPFAGRTPQSIFARRLTLPAPSARALRQAVPEQLDATVKRSMARSPVDRFQTAEALAEALTVGQAADAKAAKPRVFGAAAVAVAALSAAVVLALLIVVGRERAPESGPASAATRSLSVAVYPFRLEGDSSMRPYVGLMHTEVISELQTFDGMSVVGAATTGIAASGAEGLGAFAAAVGADVVVAASMWLLGDSVRLTGEVVSGQTEEVIHTIAMAGGMNHLVGLRGEFVLALADSLQVRLAAGKEDRLADLRDVDPAAYERYARARGLQLDPQGVLLALDLLEEAVDIDPDFADAWSTLAAVRVLAAHSGLGAPDEWIPLARAAAEESFRLDPFGRATAVFAHIAYDYEFAWEKADSLFRRALQLTPSAPEVRQTYGAFLVAMGRSAEAEREMRRAAALDPLNPFWTASVAWPMVADRPDEALAYLDALPAGHRTSATARWQRRLALQSLGRHEEIVAMTAVGDLEQILPRAAASYALTGRVERARELIAEAEAIRAENYFSPVEIAAAYTALGEDQPALDLLETAYRERDDRLAHIREIRIFDALRGEPRFQELMDRLAFPQR